MSKTVKNIEWRTWFPTNPEDFPCLCCGSGREATRMVVIDNSYNMPLCLECSKLSEYELKDRLFAK